MDAAPAPVRHTLTRAVEPPDIDELGHVNNGVYVRWVQDAAISHWTTDAPPEDQAALVWVVTRHEIDYLRPAMPGDEVRIETWVGPVFGRDFERNTEIFRARDGKVLCRARTLWCPLDRATGRPTKVGEAVRERFSVRGA
ncbi:MAG: acyl-CoA thioesterase [Candidatus Eisenbacteria bacterium]